MNVQQIFISCITFSCHLDLNNIKQQQKFSLEYIKCLGEKLKANASGKTGVSSRIQMASASVLKQESAQSFNCSVSVITLLLP